MFKKKYLVSFLLIFIALPAVSGVVEDKNNLEINNYDIDVLVDRGSPLAQKRLIEDKPRLKEKIEQIYLMRAIGNQAKKEELGKGKAKQAGLQAVIDKYYFQLKMEALKKENLPDFEPLAKIQYQTHQNDYVTPEQVQTSHILLDTQNRSDLEAQKLAEDLRKRLIAGEDFSALALEYSDDKSVSQNNGELSFYPRGKMPGEFDEVAFKMKQGEISQPVKTKFGYHLVRLDQHKAERIQTFEEVREGIINQLKGKYVQTRINDYFDLMKSDSNMKFNDSELDSYIENRLNSLEDTK